ncbi:hypothetical protein E5332_03430 [Enterorhabdus sp. NM05_H27]|nr:hypothetical protein E5332_03430 [Enterorhabdus sp. NM05_H27]
MIGETGQGTVEYAVVTAGVVCVIVALGALWRILSAGIVVNHALMAASHHLEGALGWAFDIFSY